MKYAMVVALVLLGACGSDSPTGLEMTKAVANQYAYGAVPEQGFEGWNPPAYGQQVCARTPVEIVLYGYAPAGQQYQCAVYEWTEVGPPAPAGSGWWRPTGQIVDGCPIISAEESGWTLTPEQATEDIAWAYQYCSW